MGETALCVHNHLKELKRKHELLDEQLADLQRSPSCDSLKIRGVKKQKLALKEKMSQIEDEMNRLQNPGRMNVGIMPEMTLEGLKENPRPRADVSVSPSKRDENQIAA